MNIKPHPPSPSPKGGRSGAFEYNQAVSSSTSTVDE